MITYKQCTWFLGNLIQKGHGDNVFSVGMSVKKNVSKQETLIVEGFT
jgi:hypothetical protein